METYKALAHAFGISLKELFYEVGVLPPDPDYDPIYEELYRLFYLMTPEEREMYLNLGRVTTKKKEKK